MSSRKRHPLITLNHSTLNLDESRELEWIIPNKLGGYSSLSVTGLNTNRLHGLLVSGCANLSRILYLQNLYDEIKTGDNILECSKYLHRFEYCNDSVLFYYKAKGVYIHKQITPLPDKNSLYAAYTIENNTDNDIEFRIKPALNSRNNYNLMKKKVLFTPRFFTENLVGINSDNGYITLKSDNGRFLKTPEELIQAKINYTNDDLWENTYHPVNLFLNVKADTTEKLTLDAVAYPTEKETAQVFRELINEYTPKNRILSTGKGTSLFSLLNAADTFILDVDSKKTITAGYPSLGERGRDAMIALPGLTLINGRYKYAEKILERFLNHTTHKGIPSSFSLGKPVYEDIDSSLWLIDRLYQYVQYVGARKGKKFIHTYWWTLKDIMADYAELEKDGILVHQGGTWMKHLERKNAVEVQGLWYNALKIMEYLAEIMEDEDIELYKSTCKRIKKEFIKEYWNGRYLKDSAGDDSLRPNQIILLSLDFNLVEVDYAKQIMDAAKNELLTPFGLRSLSSNDPGYKGSTQPGAAEKDTKYNGGVWPWLLGPYIKVHTRLYGNRLKARKLIGQIFEQHIDNACIGTVSEFMDGDPPHTPRGCTSYACSVSELLRCYFEDIMKTVKTGSTTQ